MLLVKTVVTYFSWALIVCCLSSYCSAEVEPQLEGPVEAPNILKLRPRLPSPDDLERLPYEEAIRTLTQELEKARTRDNPLGHWAASERAVAAIVSLGEYRNPQACPLLTEAIAFTCTIGVSSFRGDLLDGIGSPEANFYPAVRAIVKIGLPSYSHLVKVLESKVNFTQRPVCRNLLVAYLAVLGPAEGAIRLDQMARTESVEARKEVLLKIRNALHGIDSVPQFTDREFQFFSGPLRAESVKPPGSGMPVEDAIERRKP